MLESSFERSEYRYLELDHFKLSKKSIGKTKTGLMNLYSKEFDDEFDTRLQFVNLYSKTTQFNSNSKPKNTITPQIIHPRSTRPKVRKNLGHDLDQLTEDNHHEVNLSPHPSLTIMVQPNKIDYTERGISLLSLPLIAIDI